MGRFGALVDFAAGAGEAGTGAAGIGCFGLYTIITPPLFLQCRHQLFVTLSYSVTKIL